MVFNYFPIKTTLTRPLLPPVTIPFIKTSIEFNLVVENFTTVTKLASMSEAGIATANSIRSLKVIAVVIVIVLKSPL